MICQRCGQPIDHQRGDLIAQIRCEGQQFDRMVFCLKCGLEFLDWAEQRGE